jgi:hypothetical protein
VGGAPINITGDTKSNASSAALSTSSFHVPRARLHARIEGGLQVHGGDRLSIRITASYDGLGTSSFSDFGAQVWVSMPLP